jgi:hypothetical protein
VTAFPGASFVPGDLESGLRVAVTYTRPCRRVGERGGTVRVMPTRSRRPPTCTPDHDGTAGHGMYRVLVTDR